MKQNCLANSPIVKLTMVPDLFYLIFSIYAFRYFFTILWGIAQASFFEQIEACKI
jgi:hypothetical protein